MKINLLHMIMIATVFNSLQIYTAEHQLLPMQALQYHMYQAQSHNNNKKVTTSTPVSTNNPQPLTNNTPIASQQTFTVIAMDSHNGNIQLDPTDNSSLTQDNQHSTEAMLLIERRDPTGINCLIEGDTILVGCCDKNLIYTKTTAAKMLCATLCCAAIFIGLIVGIAHEL